jgi:hypothetical protein
MSFTTKQRALQKEVSELLKFLRFTTDLTGVDSRLRTSRLTLTKRELIVSAILGRYLLIDEHLSNEMCWKFFPRRTFSALWKTKRFRTFNHHVIDRLSLLQKLEFVRAQIDLPSEFCERIRALNSLRNAVAHSFFPENRKVKPKWKGHDIFVEDGYGHFFHDIFEVSQFFFARLHRQEQQRNRVHHPRKLKPAKNIESTDNESTAPSRNC